MALGLIINPFAGMGGPVGLHGSDGADVLAEARSRGARPVAAERARRAMIAFQREGRAGILSGPGSLGSDVLTSLDIPHEVIPFEPAGSAEDTRTAVLVMNGKTDLVLFAGGDGTARDVAFVRSKDMPVLGIPAGVKMHSGVFARTPEEAGRSAARFLASGTRRVTDGEVMDIDETARREGVLSASLHDIVAVPDTGIRLQGPKARTSGDISDLDPAIADYVQRMRPSVLYLAGPGTAMAALKARAGGGSLLGVDAIRDGRIVATDLGEEGILDLLETSPQARIVLSVIGGQGFLFGRGNQQLSARVIRKVGPGNIDILCQGTKLAALVPPELSVDTGDRDLDAELSGYRPVITGAGRQQVVRVSY